VYRSPRSSGYYNSSNILRAEQLQQNNYYKTTTTTQGHRTPNSRSPNIKVKVIQNRKVIKSSNRKSTPRAELRIVKSVHSTVEAHLHVAGLTPHHGKRYFCRPGKLHALQGSGEVVSAVEQEQEQHDWSELAREPNAKKPKSLLSTDRGYHTNHVHRKNKPRKCTTFLWDAMNSLQKLVCNYQFVYRDRADRRINLHRVSLIAENEVMMTMMMTIMMMTKKVDCDFAHNLIVTYV